MKARHAAQSGRSDGHLAVGGIGGQRPDPIAKVDRADEVRRAAAVVVVDVVVVDVVAVLALDDVVVVDGVVVLLGDVQRPQFDGAVPGTILLNRFGRNFRTKPNLVKFALVVTCIWPQMALKKL
jgi:hypothetical protein